MRKFIYFCTFAAFFLACTHESRVDQYRADKHLRDSVALTEQQRSLEFYQSQLDSLIPQTDSLLRYFKYEKNERYQDRGHYVLSGNNGLRILLRDDGKELLIYKEGKRVSADDRALQNEQNRLLLERAQHLQVLIADIHELEVRIQKTSLEIQKYQKRLQK